MTDEKETNTKQSKIIAAALDVFLKECMPVFKENHEMFQFMLNTIVAAQIQTGMGNAQDIIGELIGHLIHNKLIEVDEMNEEDFLAMQNMETPPKGEMN